MCLTTLLALVSKIWVSPDCLMLYSPSLTVRAATSERLILRRKCYNLTTMMRDLLSDAVGGGEDVLPGDEGAAAELSAILEQGCDPGPLTLVSRPPVDHLEGVLVVIVEPLLLLSHSAVLIVSDGVIFANTAGVRVGGAGSRGSLGWGGRLSGWDRG